MAGMNENATDGRTAGGDKAPRALPAMLDVQAVADLLGCSSRHVYRLADVGRLPRPVKLGALVRWSRVSSESWIAQGCPSCRNAEPTVTDERWEEVNKSKAGTACGRPDWCAWTAGGLRLGLALAIPGGLMRKASLTGGARQAVMLVLGTIPMFVVAGLLESFVTPSYLPGGVKILIGLAALGGTLTYLLRVGRA